jgi:hypothetical protein
LEVLGFTPTLGQSGVATGAFAKHGFNVQVIAYVKDEACNISTKTIVLTSIVSCEVLGLTTPFVGPCWGHTMSKCCQYLANGSKVGAGLTFISIKETQSILLNTITWTKKSGKG